MRYTARRRRGYGITRFIQATYFMMRAKALLAFGLGLVAHGVQACGIDWSLPHNHFEGVNEFGFVSLWENIGNIDTGDGLILPLNINFRSDRLTSSSTLGSGWHLGLLDASVVQLEEGKFLIFDPAGPFRLFKRDKKNPSLLLGPGGWKAEIKGDIITAWADCGAKLVFNKGRIASMQIKDKVFTYLYKNGQISEIQQGISTILTVKKDQLSGEVVGLVLPNHQEIGIEHTTKPRVNTIANQKIVSGVDATLGAITKTDGSKKTFEFGIDDTMNPTIKTGDHAFVWNSGTKIPIRDGKWEYNIKPGLNQLTNVPIERKNTKNQSEYWFRDVRKGQEIIQSIDEVKTIRSWFTSGILSGRPRNTVVIKDGVQKVISSISYDELGNRIIEKTSDYTLMFERNSIKEII